MKYVRYMVKFQPRLTKFTPSIITNTKNFGTNPFDSNFNQSVLNDARKTSFSGIKNTQEALFDKLQNEFQGERIDTTKRAEEKLIFELKILNDMEIKYKKGGIDSNNEMKDLFNLKRKQVLKMRGELIIQREVSGLSFDASSMVERTFPVPPSL